VLPKEFYGRRSDGTDVPFERSEFGIVSKLVGVAPTIYPPPKIPVEQTKFPIEFVLRRVGPGSWMIGEERNRDENLKPVRYISSVTFCDTCLAPIVRQLGPWRGQKYDG